jgi:hypothetical protein
MHLLSVQQKHDQSPADFANELRVEAYRCWPQEEREGKEEFLLKAFLHGMLDQKMSSVIKAMKLRNLEDAVSNAQKYYQSCTSARQPVIENHLRGISHEDVIRELRSQITELKEQMAQVLDLLKQRTTPMQRATANQQQLSHERPTYAQITKRNYSQNERTAPQTSPFKPQLYRPMRGPTEQIGIRCFNCNEIGHIARNCTAPAKAKPMHRNGKTFRNNGREFFRKMHASESGSSVIESGSRDEDEQSQLNDDVGECCAVKMVPKVDPKPQNRGKRHILYSAASDQLNEAEAWTAYIKGNRGKPKHVPKYPHTVISQSHSEAAKNKPVVSGKCASVKSKLFLDSGAEINVIDSEFLKELEKTRQTPVKFTPCNSNIKCANGSKMPVLGQATLSIELGPVRAEQKFMVVKNVFPKVIIGIRTMKTMNVCIDPVNDCAIINDQVRLPFLSKIQPQSEVSGKEKWASSGVGASPLRNIRLQS